MPILTSNQQKIIHGLEIVLWTTLWMGQLKYTVEKDFGLNIKIAILNKTDFNSNEHKQRESCEICPQYCQNDWKGVI